MLLVLLSSSILASLAAFSVRAGEEAAAADDGSFRTDKGWKTGREGDKWKPQASSGIRDSVVKRILDDYAYRGGAIDVNVIVSQHGIARKAIGPFF